MKDWAKKIEETLDYNRKSAKKIRQKTLIVFVVGLLLMALPVKSILPVKSTICP